MLDDPSPSGSGRRRRTSPSMSPTASTIRALLRRSASRIPGSRAELHARDRAGQLAHAQVLAGERLGELLAARARVAGDELAALVRVARRAEVQRLVVGDDEPAFARGDVLLLLERERAERAERAEMLAVVGRAERLRGVLDHGNAVAARRRRAPRRGRTRRSRGARR